MRTCADGVGASESGCADVCRRCGCKGKGGNGRGKGPVDISGCADARADSGCKRKGGNGWGEGPVGMSERGCADMCGRCGCKGKGHERAWMCGRVWTVWGARERVEMGRDKGGKGWNGWGEGRVGTSARGGGGRVRTLWKFCIY